VRFEKLRNNEKIAKRCGHEFRYISDVFECMFLETKIEPFTCYRNGHSGYKQIEARFNPDTFKIFIFLGKEIE
jgi:hypothetical protein